MRKSIILLAPGFFTVTNVASASLSSNSTPAIADDSDASGSLIAALSPAHQPRVAACMPQTP